VKGCLTFLKDLFDKWQETIIKTKQKNKPGFFSARAHKKILLKKNFAPKCQNIGQNTGSQLAEFLFLPRVWKECKNSCEKSERQIKLGKLGHEMLLLN
jgi:hypothetical protein